MTSGGETVEGKIKEAPTPLGMRPKVMVLKTGVTEPLGKLIKTKFLLQKGCPNFS